MIRVLLVEDDPLIAKVVLYYMKQEETYTVIWAKTGGEALSMARDRFNVVLMDILLPDVNGIDLCERLRNWHDCPVIFISCLDDSETIVKALSSGGDDFVTKPFDNKVLVARIEANLRRYAAGKADPLKNTLICGDLTLDANHHVAIKRGAEIKLSNMEFRVLLLLMGNPGVHFTPKELYRRVWGSASMGDSRTVLVHIHNLRRKLEDDPNEPQYIRMDWGEGYAFYGGAEPRGMKA